MKYVMIVLVSMVCLPALAEEKTCTVKGMECDGCVGMVKEKVCTDSYSTCEVTVKDAKNKVGQIHLVTKDASAKIDPKILTEVMKDMTYSVDKCTAGAPKPATAKGKKTT